MKNKIKCLAYGLCIVFFNLFEIGCVAAQNKRIVGIAKVNSVLILGNSITHHDPQKSIGWNGDWGMAASSQNKDFVHLLEQKIKAQNNGAQIEFGNIANTFERKFWDINEADFTQYINNSPDLIILEIGENITDSLVMKNNLDLHLTKFVNLLQNGKSSKVCVVGSFWPNKNIDKCFESVCRKNNWIFINLRGIYENAELNTAKRLYANKGVGRHPSDNGMTEIADRIWDKIKTLFILKRLN